MTVIPTGEGNVCLTAHPGVGAVGGHHQLGREGLAIFQQQQGARWPALQAGGPGRGQHLDIAGPRDGVQQRKLDHPVLDDVAKGPLTQAGGIEIDVAETVLLPHLHLLVGLQAARHYAVPGADPLQDVLTREAQGTDPVVRRLTERCIGQQAFHDGHLDRPVLEGGSEPQAHHAPPHDHHIHILHLHSLVSFPGGSPGSARRRPQACLLLEIVFVAGATALIGRTPRPRIPGCGRRAVP